MNQDGRALSTSLILERLESFNRASSMRKHVHSSMSIVHGGVDVIGQDPLTPDSGIAAIYGV